MVTKLFKGLIATSLGLTMAVGVGVGITNGKQTKAVYATNYAWQKITSTSEFVDGVTFLVTQGDYYLKVSDTTTSQTPRLDNLTLSNNLPTLAADNSNCLRVSGSGETIKLVKATNESNWLITGSANNAARINTGTTGHYWSISSAGGSEFYLKSNQDRYLSRYGTTDFRSYTNTGTNANLTLYKLVESIGGGEHVDPTGLNLDADNLDLFIGNSRLLNSTLEPENATGTVSWISSSNAVATVADGVVSANAAGSATITAFIDADDDGQVDNSEISASCTVSVTQGTMADFNSAVKGEKVDFFAYYVGKYTNAAKGYFVSDGNNGAYIYDPTPDGVEENDILHIAGTVDVYNGLKEIVDTTVVKVDAHDGLVSPATLEVDESALSSFTVSDLGRKATITGRVTNISTTPSYNTNTVNYTIIVGSSTITVVLHKSWLSEAEYNDFANKAEQGLLVTIEAYVGAYKSGTTVLSQLDSSNYQLLNPKVTAIHVETLTGVELNKNQITLLPSENDTLILSPVPGGAELGAITWISLDEDVATVSNGEVTAIGEGSTTITATAGGFSDSCEINVINAQSINLNYSDLVAGGISTTAGPQTFIGAGLKIEIGNGVANGTNNDVRIYKGQNITFRANKIYKIEFTCSNAQYGTNNFANADGLNKTDSIWNGDSTSVAFNVTGDNQVRITGLSIMYSPDDTFTYHDITFNSLGNGDFDSLHLLHGSLVNEPLPQPVKAKDTENKKRFEFAGWYYNVDPLNPNFAEGIQFTISTEVNSDLTLVAKYNEISYHIVRFETNGGTTINDIEVDHGEIISMPGNPSKAADASYVYEFAGWYTNIGLSDAFSSSTPINEDLTLYAKYNAQSISSPQSYLNSAETTATLHAVEEEMDFDVEKSMNDLVEANSYTISAGSDVTCYTNLQLNNDISVSTSGEANCGSFWGSSTYEWRLYQNKGGNVTITAANGFNLKSVTITYSQSNSGTLKNNLDASVASNTKVDLTGSSVTFTVGNTGSGTNGQVKITNIAVEYVRTSIALSNVAIRFGASIAKSSWDAINDNFEDITDYGIMLMTDADLEDGNYSSIQEAYEDNVRGPVIKIFNKCANETPFAVPYLDGENYLFKIVLYFPADKSYYDDEIHAVPFVVVGDQYYFLDERTESVQNLANAFHNAGNYAHLSDAALQYLMN